MPNRILYESICCSDTLAQLTPEAERFFYRLLVQCDDFGRFDARPSVLRSRCFQLQVDEVSLEQVEAWLDCLSEVGLIQRYRSGERAYLQVTTWQAHQRTRAARSKFPDPPAVDSNGARMSASADNRGHSRPYPDAYSYARNEERGTNTRDEAGGIGGTGGKGADAPVVADAPTPAKVPKQRGKPLAPLVDAFRELGLEDPVFIRGEGKAAQQLLEQWAPEEIALCWQDHASGEYGDDFARRDLSFDYLATRHRVGNWSAWKRGEQMQVGRSPPSRNGGPRVMTAADAARYTQGPFYGLTPGQVERLRNAWQDERDGLPKNQRIKPFEEWAAERKETASARERAGAGAAGS